MKIDASEPLKITVEDNTYIVEGKWLERLMSNVNFGDYESRMFFDKMLRENGVFQQLEDLGIKDGDIVSMYELESGASALIPFGDTDLHVHQSCARTAFITATTRRQPDSYYRDEQLDEDEMASFLRGKLTAWSVLSSGAKRLLPRGKAIKIAKREHAQACSLFLSVSIKTRCASGARQRRRARTCLSRPRRQSQNFA